MNLLRTLTKEQLYHVERLCKGEIVVAWDAEENAYVSGETYRSVLPRGNDRQVGRRGRSKRQWLGSVVVTLLQRKLLADEGGRLMPSKALAKLLGRPPAIEPPKKTVKMSRTRAARDQNAPPRERKPRQAPDRTGQVWERFDDARLILGPATASLERPGGAVFHSHPTLCLSTGHVSHVEEKMGDPFEGKPGYKRLA